MKIYIFLLLFLFYKGLFGNATSYDYLHYGQSISLEPVVNEIMIEFHENIHPAGMRSVLNRWLNEFHYVNPLNNRHTRRIKLTNIITQDSLKHLVEVLTADPDIILATPIFHRLHSRVKQTVNRSFLVCFKSDVGTQRISVLNKQNNVHILKEFPNNTFLLQIDPSKKTNGLQAANWYIKLNEVQWAQPNFYYLDWGLLKNAPVNDPLWPRQWAHRNIGQSVASGAKVDFPQQVNGYSDADMDVDQAWSTLGDCGISAGGESNILVATLDSGLDLDHPDLNDNLYSNGKDFSPDSATDANDFHGHGTCVAGIIAAEGNNGIGVVGIAYNVKILPVKIFSVYGSADDAGIASAIDYAWQQGAHILSNSWSGSSPSAAVDDAIHRAKTQGRNGKGCVIVFSSGNQGNGNVRYPAYLEDVIAVGASNMFDEKKNPGSKDWQRNWGGNYGAALDIVAPTIVYTTDIEGSTGYENDSYFDHFGGTSAACPQVAGVAALVLSADNELTSNEVQTILQNSADKIDRYAYSSSGWNEHLGYGRVNAYKAVKLALGENGEAPLIVHTRIASTSNTEAQHISAQISDPDGLATGAVQPSLYYRIISQIDSSDWLQVFDENGPAGNMYEFIIPAQPLGDFVEYYISATDNSADSLASTFPFCGQTLSHPPRPLGYHVGEFLTQEFISSDVPVFVNDDNIYYTSALNITDSLHLIDVNASISISGYIEDLAVALEAPDSTAVGIVNHNGNVGDSYLNTTLDDQADTRIIDGQSPYTGSFKPDNALWDLQNENSAGNWILRVFDDTYYNNGSTIESWKLETTYMKSFYPPLVADIPNQIMEETQNFAPINLDEHVADANHKDEQITWSCTGNNALTVSIDSNHVATITPPSTDWTGSETIVFTATDPDGLSDRDSTVFTIKEDETLPITLFSFSVQVTAKGQLVKWCTKSELYNAGFNLYRAESMDSIPPPDNEFRKLNSVLISGAGNSSQENEYQFLDSEYISQKYCWYILENVSLFGERHRWQSSTLNIDECSEIFVSKSYQNYPNPYNSETNIAFDLIKKNNVTISIYNALGQQIKILTDSEFEAGHHSITFDGSALPSGLYFYKITAGKFQQVKKMLLIK